MKKLLFFTIGIIGLNISCKGQTSVKEVEAINNEDLKYALTYLDCGEMTSDEKKHFFLKSYKLPNYSDFVIFDDEETVYKEFYYFLFSTFDESTHLEAKIYKTENMVLPKIKEVAFIDDGIAIITISFTPILIKEYHDEKVEVIANKNEANRKTMVFSISKE